MKEKLFEVVHSLELDDKLYLQDFYFYISMYHIHYHFKKNDISIPKFEKFDDENTDNSIIECNLAKIILDKKTIMEDLILYLKSVNSKRELIGMLSNILNDFKNIILFT